MNDNEMLETIAAGDEKAMQRFFMQYANDVYRFLMGRCGDSTLASDILNAVMLDVWRQADRFQGRSKVTTWLMGIARHKLIDHYRREQRHQHEALDVTMSIDPAPVSEQLVAAAQHADWVKHCIERLGGLQRDIVHLAFYQDMAYPEIAEIVECPVGTVKSRMFHAREALRRCLEKLGGEEVAHVFR
ncbi:MAG TPA: sigma-70 family RNA polymerase sigma factor [Gammaproteobacteria bacterium]|nr:sigma-70 family RNA polymerase sigma factor [Gammaproteobacteria bacterium]